MRVAVFMSQLHEGNQIAILANGEIRGCLTLRRTLDSRSI
jgi:hypothetical protein